MGTITAIKSQRRGDKRVNVFLDGAFAFSLKKELSQELGLTEGLTLSPSQINELPRQDSFRSCFDAAQRLLSYRPRSESEMNSHLTRRGFDNDSIEHALTRLKELGLLDDTSFARYWVDNRVSFSPRSRQLLRLELRRKGIDSETINEAIEGLDEGADAYRAAQKKCRTFKGYDYQTFCHKLVPYLQRRGFSYGVTRQTVDRLWSEVKGGGDSGLSTED